MKKILTTSFLVFSLSFCFSQTQKTSRLSPEEFVIMPWGWTPGDSSTLKDIYECGFNLAEFVGMEDLKNVSLAGLKAIVSDTSTNVGDAEPWSGENNWLAPGQGRIFFVKK
jgi:hypothetical protein